MRSYSVPTIALLDAGQATGHVAYFMELANSPSDGGIWSGAGRLTIDSDIYTGLQAPALATDISHEMGPGATGITVRLSSNDPYLIERVVNEDLRNRWLTIKDLTFNVQGTVLLHDEGAFFGTINEIVTQDTPANDDEPGVAIVEIRAVGEAEGLARGLGRLAAHQDQLKIDPADTGFRRTATAGTIMLAWGGSAPERANLALKD